MSTVLWVLLALFCATSIKYLPLVYFIRFYAIPIKWIGLQNSPKKLAKFAEDTKERPTRLFDPAFYYTYCCPMECDFFGLHKNNATYQTELDLARTQVMLSKFYPYFIDFRKKNNGRVPYVALGSIGLHFLREIAPFQKYWMESHILTWDSKWIFTLTVFKTAKKVHCISIGKLVFKDHRKTIPPQEVIEFCGYDCPEVQKVRNENLRFISEYLNPQELLEINWGQGTTNEAAANASKKD